MTYDAWKQETPPENKMYLSFGPEEEAEPKKCKGCFDPVEDSNKEFCNYCEDIKGLYEAGVI